MPAESLALPHHLELERWHARAKTETDACVVGGLIRNERGEVFVQQRSPTRVLFPGCWDIAGGHVEPGETLLEALQREIREETGWALRRVVAALPPFDWYSTVAGEVRSTREFDFVVEVEGDLTAPKLERSKCMGFRWLGRGQTAVLHENRAARDTKIHDLVAAVLEGTGRPARDLTPASAGLPVWPVS